MAEETVHVKMLRSEFSISEGRAHGRLMADDVVELPAADAHRYIALRIAKKATEKEVKAHEAQQEAAAEAEQAEPSAYEQAAEHGGFRNVPPEETRSDLLGRPPQLAPEDERTEAAPSQMPRSNAPRARNAPKD